MYVRILSKKDKRPSRTHKRLYNVTEKNFRKSEFTTAFFIEHCLLVLHKNSSNILDTVSIVYN